MHFSFNISVTMQFQKFCRPVPEAGFRDGTPVAHQVLTSNTTDLVSKKFLDEHFSIEQDDSHFQDTRGSVPLPLEHAENPLGVEVQNNEGSVPLQACQLSMQRTFRSQKNIGFPCHWSMARINRPQ